LGWILVFGLYLSNAFKYIRELEKRVDELEGKKKDGISEEWSNKKL